MDIWPGRPYPLGASFDGTGTNFSVVSEVAERVELCLFDETGRETRVELPEVSGYCFHGYVPHISPGQEYGYRVYGPWEPEGGYLCNPNKLLLDPYAKAVRGELSWNKAVFPYNPGDFDEDRHPEMDPKDSAPFVPKSTVISPYFDWSDDIPPKTSRHDTIIYETHVKGFTMLHPDIPSELRGTYAGLAHPVAIDYLTDLGVTTVELMPVHQFIHDGYLLERGLRNYWGYNTISFFAPHNGYSSHEEGGMQVMEFKQMVKNFHRAGLEVVLDVVYNHTAEGNHLGPILSFKGLNNPGYYRLSSEDPRYYVDYTGTGNSLNMRYPRVLQLIMDSLRYWVLEMHVDGFRFDLASTLARELHDVDRLSAFFDIILQDPVISQVKIIAEPWDIGEGGYQVGNFPVGWSEWNGKYRDCIRDFWRGQDQTLGEFAYRLTGSSDLYENTGRSPYASINFVTAHDGFTLNDLVSYNEKHNEANGNNNEDGEDFNRSWNCGTEGPTDEQEIVDLRDRQKRNILLTLLLSQGIPMVVHGDEMGRSQRGNNNVYCQDNELSWVHWDEIDESLLRFTGKLIAFRKEHCVFRRRNYFQGRPIHGADVDDIGWFTPSGEEMEEEHWGEGLAKSIGVFLNGEGISTPDLRGQKVVDDSFYLIFNAHMETMDFTLPDKSWGRRWQTLVDSSRGWLEEEELHEAGETLNVPLHSVVVLMRVE